MSSAAGVTPLPDPPIEIGDWFVDPRGDWGGARATPKVDGLDEIVTRYDDLPLVDAAPGVHLVQAIATPDFESARVRLDGGATFDLSRAHTHRLLLVTDGAVTVGGRACPSGTHVEIPVGWDLDPIVAGPVGATLCFLADGAP